MTDRIPARVRATAYVLFAVLALAEPIARDAFTDGFQVDDLWSIFMGVLLAGGFSLANANTPSKPWPWPAPSGDPQNPEG